MRGGRLREGPSRLLCTHCPQDIPKKSDAVGKGKVCEGQGGVLAQRVNRMEANKIGSQVGSGRLNERVGLDRRQGRGFGGKAQMGENFDKHRGIFDGGDMRHRAPTL